ncbi:hypothetical protein Tco_0739716 [Tanacetum coccineum]
MANLKYSDKHNMVAFLKKANESVGFTEVVDFLKGTSLRSYKAPLPEGNTSGSVEASMQLKELMVLVPNLVTRVTSLEKELKDTKQTLGTVVLKLVKKVKSLEKALKRKSKKVIVSASEGEEPEDQGRIIQDIDDDPLVSLVRESMRMNEKSTDFVTPTKASREAQEEDISPTILEAAKTLSKVASQGVSKVKSTDKGKRYRRRARSVAKIINTGLDAEEEINTSIEEVSIGSAKVDSGTASKRGQREGKAPMVEEDIQATHKTKEQIRQEEAGLEEAIKLQAQMDEEVAKQIHLDKMIAKRMAEEEELSEQQRKKANSFQNVEKIMRRMKFYVEQKDKHERSKPMTKAQQGIMKLEVPVKKTGMRRKQKARKGINIDKTAQDEFNKEREAYVKDKVKDASSESEIGLDVIPTATKPPTIRLVIKKYGANRPEEMYDRVLWGDLKTMFDPPLSDDAIWNRKYTLSKDACQVMLKMKLLDGTMDEVCYQLLKMIEKQARIRK